MQAEAEAGIKPDARVGMLDASSGGGEARLLIVMSMLHAHAHAPACLVPACLILATWEYVMSCLEMRQEEKHRTYMG